jgi:hypothetical protein
MAPAEYPCRTGVLRLHPRSTSFCSWRRRSPAALYLRDLSLHQECAGRPARVSCMVQSPNSETFDCNVSKPCAGARICGAEPEL